MSASDLPTLGPLEVELLQMIWTGGPQTARQVYETFRLSRSIAYTTIAKTLDRLVLKGLLQREAVQVKRSLSFCYTPRFNRSELLTRMVLHMMTMLGADAADQQHLALALRCDSFSSPSITVYSGTIPTSRDL
jgi:predicted transcriptional regulator